MPATCSCVRSVRLWLVEASSFDAWLSVPASADILFDTPFEERWRKAALLLGIDLATISSEAGHA